MFASRRAKGRLSGSEMPPLSLPNAVFGKPKCRVSDVFLCLFAAKKLFLGCLILHITLCSQRNMLIM